MEFEKILKASDIPLLGDKELEDLEEELEGQEEVFNRLTGNFNFSFRLVPLQANH